MLELEVEAPEILPNPSVQTPAINTQNTDETKPETAVEPAVVAAVQTPEAKAEKKELTATESNQAPKVSALSLASIKAKREMMQQNQLVVKESVQLPTEPFTETDMRLFWTKYAQKLGEKGFKIMESLLTMNDPVLNGTNITIELPNEGSKIDFESEKNGLLGYLRGHLHNHDITIEVLVNEAIENKFAFTPQDKYNRLNEINPNLELLRRTFDLDF